MDLDPTDDQAQLLIALDRLLAPFESAVHPPEYLLPGDAIETALEASGFYELCRSGGGVDGALMVERIARLPHAVEIGASGLVAPLLVDHDLPRPIALATGQPGPPVRHLPRAKTLLVDDGAQVCAIDTSQLEIHACQTTFGYPCGTARDYALAKAERLPVSVARFRCLWRIALAAEISGLADAALARTTAYVRERHQFGKPLGALQSIQHRLSECAVIVRSMKVLALKAAASQSTRDAVMAVVFAQNGLRQICYDVQQFHGAIGLTLEYPVHYWTQRLRALQGELGGMSANAQEFSCTA